MEDQKIWFERWWWSYMPCHWKGWALIAAFALAIGLVAGMLEWVVHALGRPDLDWIDSAAILPGFLWLWVVTERHTAKRRPVRD